MVANDFYDLCQGFYDGKIYMQSINASHLVLVPKKDNPKKIEDFRPISLLNTSVKLLTKLLANKLQKVILKIIHKNQYGFLNERSIHGCLAWAFEYLYLCKKSKKEMVILKLDFEKAFDRIEHQAIIEVLHDKGFGPKWKQWMKIIMSSGTSPILLNGVPSKVFHCRRRVRQGDPLSPLIFVLAADLLQSIINSAQHRGFLSLPLPRGWGTKFPIVQYADDTLLFLEACPRQLMLLKSLLNTFADSTGLKVNYQKSSIYPINVDQDKMKILALTFGCQIGVYHFTYLGLPMGPNKPKVEDFFSLVQIIERRLVSTSNFLTQAGKLEMVNSVLSAVPTFFMSTIKLPSTIIKLIDKYRKHCFWRGSDLNDRKPPLVAWFLATRPKKEAWE
jgi:retron-type reverse transcriptase